jgi:ATP-dependent DNA helicase RecQ
LRSADVGLIAVLWLPDPCPLESLALDREENMNTIAQSILHDYEQSIGRIILQCIHELPVPFGIRRVVGILRGTHAQYAIDHELHSNSMFGVLAPCTSRYIEDAIHRLCDQELLRAKMVSRYENLPALVLTERGAKFLSKQLDITLDFVATLQEQSVQRFLADAQLTDEEQALFEALQKLRRDIARKNEIPPYVICHNTALREMARTRPLQPESLYAIHGIGEKFVAQYGALFTQCIGSFSGLVLP